MAPISVLIITHNRHAALRRAIASVARQTVLPMELIVVDDGSMPPVSKDDLALAAGLPHPLPLRLVRNAAPSGPAHARNAGIAAAAGAWIAFLDDDDEFSPDKIDTVARALVRLRESADVLYHPAQIVMVNEGVTYIYTKTQVGQSTIYKGTASPGQPFFLVEHKGQVTGKANGMNVSFRAPQVDVVAGVKAVPLATR